MDFNNKKVLVIGAGISGIAAAKVLKDENGQVFLADTKNIEELNEKAKDLIDSGIEYIHMPQDKNELKTYDYIVLSPAIPLHQDIFQNLGAKTKIIGEVELAYLLAKVSFLAITGTNGKTTTTKLLHHLMAEKYDENHLGLGGNIGIPLCMEAKRVSDNGVIVAEISSYQMETAEKFKPHIASILNITPDHMARHKTIENYTIEKCKIFKNQDKHDFLVLNFDDKIVKTLGKNAQSKIYYFSTKEILKEGGFLEGDTLVLKIGSDKYSLCKINEMNIKGMHNVENALCASLMAFCAGVPIEKIKYALRTFLPVEHRIEPCGKMGNIVFYNDSKATNPEASIKAITSFKSSILICGGDDKNTSLEEFFYYAKKYVKKMILIGSGAKRFKDEGIKFGYSQEHIIDAGYNMEKAVEYAMNFAEDGDVILLSPACASFDMYSGYEERGRDFKNIVSELIKRIRK